MLANFCSPRFYTRGALNRKLFTPLVFYTKDFATPFFAPEALTPEAFNTTYIYTTRLYTTTLALHHNFSWQKTFCTRTPSSFWSRISSTPEALNTRSLCSRSLSNQKPTKRVFHPTTNSLHHSLFEKHFILCSAISRKHVLQVTIYCTLLCFRSL